MALRILGFIDKNDWVVSEFTAVRVAEARTVNLDAEGSPRATGGASVAVFAEGAEADEGAHVVDREYLATQNQRR